MKKQIALLLVFVTSFQPVFAEIFERTYDQNARTKPLQRLADINMKSFPWKEEWRSCDSMVEWIEMHRNDTLNPEPRIKRRMVFDLYEEVDKREALNTELTLNDAATWSDLNLFCGKNDQQKFVASTIDRTITECGKISLYKLLAQPTTNVEYLKKRQDVVKTILEDKKLQDDLEKALTSLALSENALLSFWKQDNIKTHIMDHEIYSIDILKPLNKSDGTLLLKNIHDHADRSWMIVRDVCAVGALAAYSFMLATDSITLPKFITKHAKKNQDRSGMIMTGLNYLATHKKAQAALALLGAVIVGFQARRNLDYVKGSFMLTEALHAIIKSMAESVNSIKHLHAVIKDHPALATFPEFKALPELFETVVKKSADLEEFLEHLESETFQGDFSLLSNHGVVLRTYILMYEIKGLLEDAIIASGNIDAHLSLAKLYQEHAETSTPYAFAEYETKSVEKPYIKLTDFWHPLVGSNKAVTNSISLGTDGKRSNIIVTGPNEGGKSTTLKAITLNLLMAQTIGLVPARELAFTPFSSLATYLNITDDVGSGNSLFKSEVLRTQELLEKLNSLQQNEFSFTVFDEVFNGTSPVEGEAAACSVARHLSAYPKNICLIATHFNLMTDLENTTDSYTNYKVSVEKRSNGSIAYPYKLEEGISHQHVAIDILRNQGFANDILDQANAIVKKGKLE